MVGCKSLLRKITAENFSRTIAYFSGNADRSSSFKLTGKLEDDYQYVVCLCSVFFFFFKQNTFRTPVYTTSQRRNAMGVGLVFEADLKTEKHTSHWVLQGVCLTLNAD